LRYIAFQEREAITGQHNSYIVFSSFKANLVPIKLAAIVSTALVSWGSLLEHM